MIRNTETSKSSHYKLRKVNRDGRIRKNDGKVSELSTLKKKYAKVDVELCLDEEKDKGRTIMINLNTIILEVARRNLLEYLNIHPLITQVVLAKNAKVVTEEGSQVEYHLDVDFKVKEEAHEVKLKQFTTTVGYKSSMLIKESVSSMNI